MCWGTSHCSPPFWTQGTCHPGLSVLDKNSFIVILHINITLRKDLVESAPGLDQFIHSVNVYWALCIWSLLVVTEKRRTPWAHLASKSWTCARDGLDSQPGPGWWWGNPAPLLLFQQQCQLFYHCLLTFLLLRPCGRTWLLLHMVSVPAICTETPLSGFQFQSDQYF